MKLMEHCFTHSITFVNNSSKCVASDSTVEINSIIIKLKNHKAPGINNLKTETVELVAQHIEEPIKFLFNDMVETGHFSSALKSYQFTKKVVERKLLITEQHC